VRNGTLALMLASGGASVTGVDPEPGMLRVARSKDPGERVSWRLGYSGILESESAEFAVMSGHVAQVFTEDDALLAALRDLRLALTPGGLLAFESRNPGARKWEAWTRGKPSAPSRRHKGPSSSGMRQQPSACRSSAATP
jgi:2-polyprenyl-3-methyl-5-hydroxy-6-metoxy-1,4-benzoquinol methylase